MIIPRKSTSCFFVCLFLAFEVYPTGMKPDLGGGRVTVQGLNPVELGGEGGYISWLGGTWINVRGLDCP